MRDLMANAKKAVRAMIEWLVRDQGLSLHEAYAIVASPATLRSARSSTSRTGSCSGQSPGAYSSSALTPLGDAISGRQRGQRANLCCGGDGPCRRTSSARNGGHQPARWRLRRQRRAPGFPQGRAGGERDGGVAGNRLRARCPAVAGAVALSAGIVGQPPSAR
jgi:hypothetical protein